MNTPFSLVDLETSEAEIAAVERAIADLESGAYGRCSTCGGDISDVVKTNPLATECVTHHAPLTLSLDEPDDEPASLDGSTAQSD
jgi:RNA polymerase-binding transcription factor DksA